ncbi:3D domain-containing protein [Alkalihalophilus pseudofirmus]|uniref:3D domain-containing protein n=1 Tax=Alkalihalophilus pseudofirmus TaxID=79885 RepID=UPI00259B4BE7|nr:3D domain-containing protein [Alkalihalophilus pseudofirmus]WEG18638.1 3D domain-containing protein [Alkalihalophilus pseudofirmus]
MLHLKSILYYITSNKRKILSEVVHALFLVFMAFLALAVLYFSIAYFENQRMIEEKDAMISELESRTGYQEEKLIEIEEENKLQLDTIKELKHENDELRQGNENLSLQLEQWEQKHKNQVNINKEKDSEISRLKNRIEELDKKVNFKQASKGGGASKESTQNNSSDTSSNGGGWQSFQMTHYTARCKGCIGITATGHNVKNTIYQNGMRVIAVDPNRIPLGSTVEVKRSDGTIFKAYASDTGGRIKGNIVDLLVADKSSARSKGRQQVQIRIIN